MMVTDIDRVVFVHLFLPEDLEVPVILVTGLEATVTVLALADHLQGVLLLLGDGVQAIYDEERLLRVTIHLLTHHLDASTFGTQFTENTIIQDNHTLELLKINHRDKSLSGHVPVRRGEVLRSSGMVI